MRHELSKTAPRDASVTAEPLPSYVALMSPPQPPSPATGDNTPPRLPRVRDVATCADIVEQHVRLRDRGMYWEGQDLVVAGPGPAAQALAHPALSVATGGAPEAQTLPLRTRMARFSDGPEHARRRAFVLQLLPAATGLAAAAERTATAILDGQNGVFDVMPVARTVPVRVLAQALGVAPGDLERVVGATGELCDALAPALASWTDQPDAGPAAQMLETVLAATGPDGPERTAAAVGILIQARDATAALIGAAVLAADADDAARSPDGAVERVLRCDAPVQSTRRVATENFWLGGVRVPRGSTVWLLLGAAENGQPSGPATFGGGPHECPGSAQARALAAGVLAALKIGRWIAVDEQRVRYEPRPNLRVPASVLMRRP